MNNITVDGTYNNARNYTFEEVARSFVSNREYSKLSAASDSLLMGPRGCGKTTLMKMLSPMSFAAWASQSNDGSSRKPNFFSVYVATDIQWHHQLGFSERLYKVAPRFCDRIAKSSISLAILNSLAQLLDYLCKSPDCQLEFREADAVDLIAEMFCLEPKTNTLESLQDTIDSKLTILRTKTNIAEHRVESDENAADEVGGFDHCFYVDFLLIADTAFKRINRKLRFGNQRWALCFDELELAPLWLQNQLFGMLRSQRQFYYLKLSSFPMPGLSAVALPTPGDDFMPIRIWPSGDDDERIFCCKLATKHLNHKLRSFDKNSPRVDLDRIFSDPKIMDRLEKTVKEYEEGSAEYIVIKEAATIDLSIYKILDDKGIDPMNPVDPLVKGKNLKDEVLRKIKPVALYRSFYLHHGKGGKKKRRSRKTIPFCGKDSLLSISDGNPRRLINLIDLFANFAFSTRRSKKIRRISAAAQAKTMRIYSDRFIEYVQCLPSGVLSFGDGSLVSLIEIVNKMGEFLRYETLYAPAKLDPVGHFVVDKEVPEKTRDLIKKGLDYGVFVLLESSSNDLGSNLIGKKVRLTYTLAPKFRFLARKGSLLRLSKVLSGDYSSETAQPAPAEQLKMKGISFESN